MTAGIKYGSLEFSGPIEGLKRVNSIMLARLLLPCPHCRGEQCEAAFVLPGV